MVAAKHAGRSVKEAGLWEKCTIDGLLERLAKGRDERFFSKNLFYLSITQRFDGRGRYPIEVHNFVMLTPEFYLKNEKGDNLEHYELLIFLS